MKDKSIIRSFKALAERACANFSNHYCLPEDRACYLINTRYPGIHDGPSTVTTLPPLCCPATRSCTGSS